MGVLIDFLVDNYIYFVFVAVLLILALIGYVVDSAKEKNGKTKQMEDKEDDVIEIPIAALDSNVTLGSTVNQQVNKDNANVNPEVQANSAAVPPVQPKGM